MIINYVGKGKLCTSYGNAWRIRIIRETLRLFQMRSLASSQIDGDHWNFDRVQIALCLPSRPIVRAFCEDEKRATKVDVISSPSPSLGACSNSVSPSHGSGREFIFPAQRADLCSELKNRGVWIFISFHFIRTDLG
jgi:hypothetical protein